eukprot:CAMPEP_0119051462 /NCGR_PEP_ID=MMETSP1177-20130426/73068_1 /TAXON_ID=2985 /ORGANISM="Ochromonas sp, Strain CCMP1899" /LENGTH=58 /DNA_ID=CAMNT_0007030669 /DNA_START=116 /DNA_END=289 /DNA_ORIENTATION=-
MALDELELVVGDTDGLAVGDTDVLAVGDADGLAVGERSTIANATTSNFNPLSLDREAW